MSRREVPAPRPEQPPPVPVDLGELVETAAVIVCGGPGGVGKTTTAAVLALEAARRGRRSVVVTIDPAKRLADALGLAGGLSNEPRRITLRTRRGSRPTSGGELWATMLDTRSTFDAIVARYSASPQQAERITSNRFYRNIAGALPGTQEYMAAEKLYELHEDERFDLVVVDTPPARQALDFLDASERLSRFLDHRLYQALTLPSRVGLRVVNVAAQTFLRTVSRVVGGAVIHEAIEFFQAFDGMEAGFRHRSAAVTGLLRSPATRYVVVTSPRWEAIREARWFAERLGDHGSRVSAVVVNRGHPRFETRPAPELATIADDAERRGDPFAPAWRNLAELTAIADAESIALAPLLGGGSGGSDPLTAAVPLLVGDVHDLRGLDEVARLLFAGAGTDG